MIFFSARSFQVNAQFNGYLYAQRGITSNLQQVIRQHPLTGACDTIISLSGFAGGTTALTLDQDHNLCFFLGWNTFFQHRVFTVNVATGSLVSSVSTSIQSNVGDPCYNASDGLLYCMMGTSSFTIDLVSVNPVNGVCATLGSYNLGSATALTLDTLNQRGFFVGTNSSFQQFICTLDLTNGNMIAMIPLSYTYPIGDPQFHPMDGLLYAQRGVDSYTQQVLKLDPATGSTDTLGTYSGFMGGTTALTLSDTSCYFIGWDNAFLQRIYVVELSTGNLTSMAITEAQMNCGDPAFSNRMTFFPSEGLDTTDFGNAGPAVLESTDTTDAEIPDFTGIEAADTDNALIIFPNPANNYIHLQTDLPYDIIRIVNTNGQLVHQQQTPEKIIHLNLESGLYFVILHNGEQRVIRKLLVEAN